MFHISMQKVMKIGSMQITNRWRSNWLKEVSSCTFGITIWNPWSNKSDADLEDSACTVRVLLSFPIALSTFRQTIVRQYNYSQAINA